MMYNELALVNGTYVLMSDVDRITDVDYETIEDARQALQDAEDEGYDELWIAYVEDGNLMFEEGESA